MELAINTDKPTPISIPYPNFNTQLPYNQVASNFLIIFGPDNR